MLGLMLVNRAKLNYQAGEIWHALRLRLAEPEGEVDVFCLSTPNHAVQGMLPRITGRS